MKVLVAVKRTVDHAVKIRLNQSLHRVELKNVKMAINPFCEIAIEQAVQMKEKKLASEVIAVSVGLKSSQEQLRYCMALGADRGILVESKESADVDVPPLRVAQALESIIREEKPDLVFLGKQSIDGDNKQTGSMLAGLLDWPEATNVSSIKFINDSKILVEEEMEYGLRTLEIPVPAVITTDLRLNTPRYPKLPDIVKAKKKPLKVVALDSLCCSTPGIKVDKLTPPEQRKGGKMCKDVDELINELHTKGVLLCVCCSVMNSPFIFA